MAANEFEYPELNSFHVGDFDKVDLGSLNNLTLDELENEHKRIKNQQKNLLKKNYIILKLKKRFS